MINYATKTEIIGSASRLPLEEQKSLRRTAASRDLTGSTFLSHSSKDDDLVTGAIKILENHGAKIYIDSIDPEMPPYTSERTANLLKDRIKQTKRFILLASANSKDSRWVPWELGVADGYKGFSNIALFPAVDNRHDNDWVSWEYLGLYRRIVWGDLQGHTSSVWMVYDHKTNSATSLADWLYS